jgi:hypothetical protein
MSWDITLYLPHENADWEDIGEWNYTHNTNKMIGAAVEAIGKDPGEAHFFEFLGPTWYRALLKMNGREGAEYLQAIIDELEAKPDTYKEFNPSNGWGNYDSLLSVLKRMQKLGEENPSAAWSVFD